VFYAINENQRDIAPLKGPQFAQFAAVKKEGLRLTALWTANIMWKAKSSISKK